MAFRLGKKPEPPKPKEEPKKEEKKKEDPLKKIEKDLEKIGPLVALEKSLKLSKIKIVLLLALGFVYSVLTLLNFYGEYLSNMLAFLFPTYQSMKAIDEGDKGQYKQWLSFWVVLGIIQQIEYIMGLSLLFKMFPLYYFLKSALLVFLMAPAFKGASWIYNAIINLGFPVLKKHIASHFHPEEKKPDAPPPAKTDPPKAQSFFDVVDMKTLKSIKYSR